MEKLRVMVAMSGGVDSSVAAAVLQQEGYEVVGVTLKLWGGESDSGCCSISDVDDARRVADRLGIEHHTFNFSEDFDAHVVQPYIEAHAAGRTPNPCIECNRHLKFDRLAVRAAALGFDLLATGHHARVVDDGQRRWIARGHDRAKDQSYVLAMLTQKQLAGLVLPIGTLTKDAVRAMAADLGLRTAHKPDSQDVCFITSTTKRSGFLAQRLTFTPGRIVDLEGNEVGSVDAVELVTTGQRRGLQLSGGAEPRYVVSSDVSSATVTIGRRSDLLCGRTEVDSVSWAHEPTLGMADVQVSAHGSAARARLVASDEGTLCVEWEKPHQRVAPGQTVAFYFDDRVVGSGTAL